LRHLDRLLRDHGESPVRSRASLMAGRMRMDMNDPARGCDLLAAAYASAGPNERDVIDQAQTAGATCPTSIVVMAEREPPPMGITRASRAGAPAAVVSVSPRRAPARTGGVAVAAATPGAPVARRESVTFAAPRRGSTPVRAQTPLPILAPSPAASVVQLDSVTRRTPAPSVARQPVTPSAAMAPSVARPDVAPSVTVTTPNPVATPSRSEPATAVVASPGAAGRYGVQFAAYNDRPGAEKLAGMLQERGISARVDGTSAPYRVRAGRFTTRAEAEAAAVLWRRGGQAVMIVPLGPTP